MLVCRLLLVSSSPSVKLRVRYRESSQAIRHSVILVTAPSNEALSKFSFMNIAEHWEGVMRNLFGLLLAVALAAGAAALVTPHPSAATPILADYSGASY
jgi:hypothetical protein